MRASFVAVAALLLAAGCSSTSTSQRGAPKSGSLEALWRSSGQSVALIPGTSDYSPGVLRISFLVVDPRGRVVSRPRARVWVARSLQARPFAGALAQLETIDERASRPGAVMTDVHCFGQRPRAPCATLGRTPARAKLLFPLPDGPIMATNCRDGTSNDIPRTISTSRAPFRMVLTRFRTAIMIRF